MNDVRFETHSAGETERCGEVLADLLLPGDVILLSGDLGAGKTCLTKGIARGLGVVEPVTSPTFNIMLVHEGRLPLYHFDLYRLQRGDELEGIDYYATLEAGGVSVVEWGDRFEEARPFDGMSLQMHITGDDDRAIDVEPLGARGRALAAAWGRSCATGAEPAPTGES